MRVAHRASWPSGVPSSWHRSQAKRMPVQEVRGKGGKSVRMRARVRQHARAQQDAPQLMTLMTAFLHLHLDLQAVSHM